MVMKLATYNIQHGTNLPVLLENILRLRDSGVTVICLQEVHDFFDGISVGEKISEALGDAWKGTFYLGEGYALGLGVFWLTDVLELEDVQTVALPRLGKKHFLERWWIGPELAERGALSCVFRSGDRSIRVTTTHLDWQGGYQHRVRQLSHLIDVLGDHPETDIVCGDLNTCMPSWFYTRYKSYLYPLLSSYEDAFPDLRWTCDIRTLHKDDGPPLVMKALRALGFRCQQRLDHVFYRNSRLKQAEMLDVLGSDHYPLVVEIDLNAT